jgi:hypothetical protein
MAEVLIANTQRAGREDDMKNARLDRLERSARGRGLCPHCNRYPDEPPSGPSAMTEEERSQAILSILDRMAPDFFAAYCRSRGYERMSSATGE